MTAAELQAWWASPSFGDLDREFARLVGRLPGGDDPRVQLAAFWASHRRSQGDVCVNLADWAGTALPNESEVVLAAPALEEWRSALRAAPEIVGSGDAVRPLVLEAEDRLYLRRYAWLEARLADHLRKRAAHRPVPRLQGERLRQVLADLFPAGPGDGPGPDWQKVAALAALRSRLCLISGGPGTGKTRTVVQILALLLHEAAPAPLRIAVAAPTGKAAARLQDTLRAARARPGVPEMVAAALPTEVPTLHRLLGAVPGTTTYRHHADHPLPVDVLVVDEASMVDLALMTRLMDAVPADARVLLLGDKDQLASVEAGAVLAEVGGAAPLNRFSAEMAAAWREVDSASLPLLGPAGSPLADVLVQLERNHRFPAAGAISRVSRAVRQGEADEAWSILQATTGGVEDGVAWRELPGRSERMVRLREAVREGYGPVFAAATPEEALARMGAFRILAALREGPYGVSGLNTTVEGIARESGWVHGHGLAYRGRQILITANDPATRLFNGDVGILWPDDDTGGMAAWFPGGGEGVRRVAVGRLPTHQTAYALTVHKSQGSEYGEVLFVLPDRRSPVLTRELVYTGLTRATRRTEVWARADVFRAAVANPTRRASGLRWRLESGR